MDHLTRQFYQQNAQNYADVTRMINMETYIRRFIRLLPPQSQIIDIGCGAGRDLKTFKECGFHATGIDDTSEMAKLAQEYSHCPVYVADIKHLPIASASQDGIWLCAVLVHLSPEEWAEALSEIIRIAKDGAVVFISVKEGNGSIRTQDQRLFWLYTQEQMRQLFSRYPFSMFSWEKNQGKEEIWINFWLRVQSPDKNCHTALTYAAAYQWGRWKLSQHGLDTQCDIEAKWLLEHLLQAENQPTTNLPILDSEQLLSLEQEKKWFEFIQQRSNHCPLAYLIEHQSFLEWNFIVRPGVLIPRPETELLVLWIVQNVQRLLTPHNPQQNFTPHDPQQNSAPHDPQQNLAPHDPQQNSAPHNHIIGLDLCTGSGCIAISILKYLPQALMIASDLSYHALQICAENAKKEQVQERLIILQGDLFGPVFPNHSLDFVVSNPPYIAESEYLHLMPEVRDYEPKMALVAEDGLAFYRKILANVSQHLRPNGYVILELGQGQLSSVIALLPPSLCVHEIIQDFQGIARVLILCMSGDKIL